ncbi:septation protein SepH [Bifidobacterium tibiigranuli]|jgi:hypothetical protein|uniref:septation protein SepH n=1 Tax=Bifidobacterium tibiigranuli TaxID=2172043 RepID=UPI0026EF60E5|nr:septation protein SepH [Bifidobacterium tibiigranuli]MCI1649245.1 septation protein SepH [Bifidobacterium tibiigranuli]MCI2185814.1 septation protein SepH [Bifidobacterium tibiigranuli]MCI2203125.1 septation protein SepH [Bifidobacterium tibiigranuli]
MPEKPLTQASFVTVSPSGDLVFSADGSQFALEVNDTLERAILEAKQIKSESLDVQQPSSGQSLPISQIQTLIRAGAEPAHVAQRYGLSPALVRRFSASVQTEKQYAIEQFLIVPAPKESRVHTMAELIERTLATARIGMESLKWTATRRGLEPWRITAAFDSAGRHLRAEWTWNMHDNAVTCLNPTATRLLGGLNPHDRDADDTAANTDGELDDAFSIVLGIPGDSIRSARIERAVSAWGAGEGEAQPQNRSQDGSRDMLRGSAHSATPASGGAKGSPASAGHPAGDERDTQGFPGTVVPGKQASADGRVGASVSASADASALNLLPLDVSPRDAASAGSTASDAGIDADTATSHAEGSAAVAADSVASAASAEEHGTASANDTDDAAAQSGRRISKESKANAAKPSKRKSRRSAVPSWDEILFGD